MIRYLWYRQVLPVVMAVMILFAIYATAKVSRVWQLNKMLTSDSVIRGNYRVTWNGTHVVETRPGQSVFFDEITALAFDMSKQPDVPHWRFWFPPTVIGFLLTVWALVYQVTVLWKKPL
jgi:hypothetical protein